MNNISPKRLQLKFLLFIASFLIVAVILLYRFKSADNSAAWASAKVDVSVPVKVIDLDTISRSSAATGTFKIHNLSKGTLVIQKVRPDCHCTVSEMNKKIVQPGDSAEVNLTFKFTDKDYGYFQKSAFIESNSTKNPILLTIRGFLSRK